MEEDAVDDHFRHRTLTAYDNNLKKPWSDHESENQQIEIFFLETIHVKIYAGSISACENQLSLSLTKRNRTWHLD